MSTGAGSGQGRKAPDGFSVAAYRQLLTQALGAGYRLVPIREHFAGPAGMGGSRTILLRHDVDLALEDAVRLGAEEAELDVRATYFVRFGSPRYDPLSRIGKLLVAELLQQGHEVGLHTEANLLPSDEATAVTARLRQEKHMLESVIGSRVEGVAVHLPKRGTRLFEDYRPQDFGFTYEAYCHHLIDAYFFLSDSNRKWKPTKPQSVIGSEPKIYLSTHPYWWVNDSLSPDDVERLRLMLLAEVGVED